MFLPGPPAPPPENHGRRGSARPHRDRLESGDHPGLLRVPLSHHRSYRAAAPQLCDVFRGRIGSSCPRRGLSFRVCTAFGLFGPLRLPGIAMMINSSDVLSGRHRRVCAMELPQVLLDNSDAVYEFYRSHRQNRMQAYGAYALLSRRYRPRVSYAPGARDRIAELLRQRTPLLIAINHLSRFDPYTVAAAAWRSELRPIIGRARVLAKDELFEQHKQRRRIDMMGGIPVFRGTDHGVRAVNAAGQQMMDVCAQRIAGGDCLAVFPEGTCNDVDPARVQSVGSGIGHIGFRSAKLGASPALVSMGLSYGPRPDSAVEPTKEEARSASFYLGVPVTDLPTRPAEIARLVRSDLQRALDGAVAAY